MAALLSFIRDLRRRIKDNRQGLDRGMKTLVIGLDGAEPSLIEKWQDQLPALARLRSEGVCGKLNSTTPAVTGPAWLSFASGMNPGKHGYFYWERRVRGAYAFEPLSSKAIQDRSLWELLSRAGYRVGAINVPATYPPVSVNGVLVSGLGNPSIKTDYTHPTWLKSVLESRFGYSSPEAPRFGTLSAGRKLQLIEENLEKQVAACEWLLTEQDFDFFMVVFGATDLAQHYFWTDMEHESGRYKDSKYGNAILDTYIRADNAVARLLNAVDPETNVFIVSDHGFGPQFENLNINRWLVDNGYLKVNGYKRSKLGALGWAANIAEGLGIDYETVCFLMRRLSALGLQSNRAGHFLAAVALNFRSQFPSLIIDWSATRAYSMAQDSIYLNIKGRDQSGTVAPEMVDSLIAELSEGLSRICDPTSGEPLVLNVRRKEELYQGAYLPNMPDIVLKLKEGHQTRPHLTRKLLAAPDCGRTGCHRQFGIFIAWGPDVQKGTIVDADIMDVAPTILHSMGVGVPQMMDGRVLQEIIRPGSAADGPTRYERDTEYDDPVDPKSGLTSEQEEQVREHLRGLGYL